ncbi:MAG: hypothetical protein J5875_02660 [Paludibacteraceae bacterium]|nr:hypothetical protein [Paludibacteraceae bacterium]
MFYYREESRAERRERRDRSIKADFQQLTIEEKVPVMVACEALGYKYFLQEREIRHILRQLNKKWQKLPQ